MSSRLPTTTGEMTPQMAAGSSRAEHSLSTTSTSCRFSNLNVSISGFELGALDMKVAWLRSLCSF